MTETYKAWHILPSGKPAEIEIVRDAGSAYVVTTKDRWLDRRKIYYSRQEAVAAGIKAVDADIQKNARQRERLLKRRDVLLRSA